MKLTTIKAVAWATLVCSATAKPLERPVERAAVSGTQPAAVNAPRIQPRAEITPGDVSDAELNGHGFSNVGFVHAQYKSRIYSADWNDKQVIVKTFRYDFVGNIRFKAETDHLQSIWAVDQTAVPQIFGTLPDLKAIVMERLLGGNLWEAVQDGYFQTPAARRQLLVRLSNLLVSVHKAGVSHYNIQPENIMIREALSGDKEEDQGEICVVDFDRATSRGYQSVKVITEAFASPEQVAWDGKGGPRPTEKSDVYSAVKTVYTVMFGPTLDLLSTPAEMGEVLHKSLGYYPKLSKPLQQIFANGLQADPNKRWTAEQLAEAAANLRDKDLKVEKSSSWFSWFG